MAQGESLRHRLRVEHLERELKEVQDSLNAERERMQVWPFLFMLKLLHILQTLLSYIFHSLKVTAKTLSQHDELMKKTETMNVLVETNKMLRDEKERLEQELQQTQAKVKQNRLMKLFTKLLTHMWSRLNNVLDHESIFINSF